MMLDKKHSVDFKTVFLATATYHVFKKYHLDFFSMVIGGPMQHHVSLTTGTIVFFTFQTIVTSNFHVLKKNSRFMKSCSMSAVFVHLQGHSWHGFEQIYSLTSSPPSLETWSCWVLAGWRPAWEMFSKQLFFPEYFCSFVFTLSPWVSLVHGLSAARS